MQAVPPSRRPKQAMTAQGHSGLLQPVGMGQCITPHRSSGRATVDHAASSSSPQQWTRDSGSRCVLQQGSSLLQNQLERHRHTLLQRLSNHCHSLDVPLVGNQPSSVIGVEAFPGQNTELAAQQLWWAMRPKCQRHHPHASKEATSCNGSEQGACSKGR